ncbi:NAD(P)-binding protein [Sporormia fimetaria CBS 119925]|uniref:NAD(P)-binding protein n=1 Tax=Sporormia fimetaria CBS 119925 TaxID=1340428 RepID=A0A6A6VCH5_9PLEO|nr:NAD(P)-binding protein [Sporormia fimetaria CBS 119925]
MAFALKGVAYITGAGSGIGQSTALALARQGVRSFTLLDRNAVTETASQLKKSFPGISIKELEMDVTDEKAVNHSVEQTVKEFGRLDYAFNNAGVGGAIDTTDKMDRKEFDRVLGVNTLGVWLCERAQIRQMLKQEKLTDSYRSYRGSIVNMASMYGVIGPSADVPATAYATSKHAVIGMTRADAAALALKGIKINAICPGYVATPLIGGAESMEEGGAMEMERKKVPLQRLGNVEEIADCVAFLHSDASSFMIGASLVVDGGFTIQ